MPKLLGLDLSNNNPTFDAQLAADCGRAFAFHKAAGDKGDLGTNDPYFFQRWRAMGDVGLVRGAYHFARPDTTSPADSVTLLERAFVAPLAVGDLVALDWEVRGPDDDHWVPEWLNLAQQTFNLGARLLYTGAYMLDTLRLETRQWLAENCVLWLASYGRKPSPPTGFSGYPLWQFTASGRVPGVEGDCDEDVFDGTADELRALGVRA